MIAFSNRIWGIDVNLEVVRMWRYEIRDTENRLLDMRREYFTEQATQDAGKHALRVVQDITPGRELKLIIEADE